MELDYADFTCDLIFDMSMGIDLRVRVGIIIIIHR